MVFRIHWLGYVTVGTMYSVFRIQSARLRYRRYIVFGFSHTLARLRYRRHIVFGFSHTFGSVTLPEAHCIRFFAYIWLGYVTVGTLYLVFRIQSARLRYWRHIVFGFSHTIGSLRYWRHIVFGFSHTIGSLRYLRHIVFGFSHTFVRKLD
ncbi:hypothetical protein M2444_005483 [Paenibacillus sp. PastF-3]|nr:hypothetical protein [Paenibacillus sp. PastF-3]